MVIPTQLLTDEVNEIRGASGARLIIGPEHTIKLDVERTGTFVRDQGAWLSRWSVERGINMLPKVSEIFAGGYTMETVHVPPLRELDVTELCERILSLLESQLWPKETGRMFTYDNFLVAHRPYVQRLVRDVLIERDKYKQLNVTLRDFYQRINWNSLTSGLTHGDCIVDNVGFKLGTAQPQSHIILLDPIPATDALPNWRVVDVGRIIQSMIGYEDVRYHRSSNTIDHDAATTTVLNWYMPNHFNVNEARACLYFSVIHMLRAVRTTTPGTAARLGVWFLVNKLIEVTEQWMR